MMNSAWIVFSPVIALCGGCLLNGRFAFRILRGGVFMGAAADFSPLRRQ